MSEDVKLPSTERTVERRSRDRVPEDADWETKVLARIRGKLRRSADGQPANWEEQVAATMQERLQKDDE